MEQDEDFGLKMGQIVARCWADEDFKQRLMSDTATVLGEYDIRIPEGMNFHVVENTDNNKYFILPSSPEEMASGTNLSQVYGANCWPVAPST